VNKIAIPFFTIATTAVFFGGGTMFIFSAATLVSGHELTYGAMQLFALGGFLVGLASAMPRNLPPLVDDMIEFAASKLG
jgi:hypothetical protein